MRLAYTAGRCEQCPSREWCNAYLAINQTSRSGAAYGSMSEIGNVPIFSGSESRFREGPLAHDVRNDRCDKCNYLRSIKSTSTGVWAAAGIRSGEKMLPIEALDRRRPSSRAELCSNFKQIICSSTRSGTVRYGMLRKRIASCGSINIFTYFNVQIVIAKFAFGLNSWWCSILIW